METNFVRRSVLAFALVGALSPLAIVDCASSNAGNGNPDGGVCPVSAPISGSACLADSTMCTYRDPPTPGQLPGCFSIGPPSYVCSKGKWQEISYAAGGGVLACPATTPTQSASCSPYPCVDDAPVFRPVCSYNCDTGHGTAASATCVNGSWTVEATLGVASACPADAGADARDASDAARD